MIKFANQKEYDEKKTPIDIECTEEPKSSTNQSEYIFRCRLGRLNNISIEGDYKGVGGCL